MLRNQTSMLKVMTIWISRELLFFNFEHLDTLCIWIGHPCEMLWAFEFLESFRCSISSLSICYAPKSDIRVKSYHHLNFLWASIVQFRVSRYVMRLSRTSEWKVMTISISRELSMFNFERLDILYPRIGHPCENLWPLEFLESYCRSLLSVSICYASESDIRVKSYDHFNFYRASVVQFQASRYIMCLNRTSERKVMTIGISRELTLFNFECLDMLCAWIGHPNENLDHFEFLENFRCSI